MILLRSFKPWSMDSVFICLFIGHSLGFSYAKALLAQIMPSGHWCNSCIRSDGDQEVGRLAQITHVYAFLVLSF